MHVLFLHAEASFSGSTERLYRAVRDLVADGTHVTVFTSGGSRVDLLRAAGAEVEIAELSASPFAAVRTRRRVARLDPDVVHATSASVAYVASRLGRPYVQELGGTVRQRIPRHRSHLAAVVLPCPTLVEAAVNRGRLPRDLARVVRHSPAVLEREPSFRHPIRVGCAGRLDAAFGGQVFVDTARELSARALPLHFFVFGEGPEEEPLRRSVRELALADRMTIASPGSPDTAELLSALDVFVCCRLEGSPGWLDHEALALGRPAIFSTSKGVFDEIEDGVDGLLVERGDVRRLVDAIAGLVEEPEEARRMGRLARQRRRTADVLPIGQALEEVYADVLDPTVA